MKELYSELPFKVDNNSIFDKNNSPIVNRYGDIHEQDVEYIAEACNNYPKAIGFIKEMRERLLGKSTYYKPPYTEKYSFIKDVDEFLNLVK